MGAGQEGGAWVGADSGRGLSRLATPAQGGLTQQRVENPDGFFFLKIGTLFIFFRSEGKGGRKRGRQTSISSLLHTPQQGSGPPPRLVP